MKNVLRDKRRDSQNKVKEQMFNANNTGIPVLSNGVDRSEEVVPNHHEF